MSYRKPLTVEAEAERVNLRHVLCSLREVDQFYQPSILDGFVLVRCSGQDRSAGGHGFSRGRVVRTWSTIFIFQSSRTKALFVVKAKLSEKNGEIVKISPRIQVYERVPK